MVSLHGVNIGFIDCLQLIQGLPKKNNREQEIAAAIRIFKNLAKELNISLIISSQLNRSVEYRSGSKRPMLADLRDSGALEEEADKVLFLHRPDKYGLDVDELGNSTKNKAEIMIAKNRSGPEGEIMLMLETNFGRFYEKVTDPKAYGDILPEDLPDNIPPY